MKVLSNTEALGFPKHDFQSFYQLEKCKTCQSATKKPRPTGFAEGLTTAAMLSLGGYMKMRGMIGYISILWFIILTMLPVLLDQGEHRTLRGLSVGLSSEIGIGQLNFIIFIFKISLLRL